MIDFKEKVIEFWERSINQTLLHYDFECFFTSFRQILKEKIALHGLLTLDDYIAHVSKYYDMEILEHFGYNSKHTGITFNIEDIKRQIFEPRYKSFRILSIANKNYILLLSLYRDLLKAPYSDKTKNALLMDRCIHAEHRSGTIIGLDIEKIRKGYERATEKLCSDVIFNILNRNGLEEKISQINEEFNAIFMDFNDIHDLNQLFGYEKVNSKIRRSFEVFRSDKILIGRWFSGDEMVIIYPINVKDDVILARLSECTNAQGLSFKYALIHQCNSLKDLKESIKRVKWNKN